VLAVYCKLRDLGDLDFDLEVVGGEESWQKLDKSDIRSSVICYLPWLKHVGDEIRWHGSNDCHNERDRLIAVIWM
jgi:hypothetical protein